MDKAIKVKRSLVKEFMRMIDKLELADLYETEHVVILPDGTKATIRVVLNEINIPELRLVEND